MSAAGRILSLVLVLGGAGCGGCGGDDDGGGADPDGGEAPSDAATAGVTVRVTGAGEGTVSSDVGGIDCATADGTCGAVIEEGATVTLTATPADGYLFLAWLGGGCGRGGTCTLRVDADVEVSVAFVPLVYEGNGVLDGGDEALPGGANNIWTARTDGEGAAPVTELTADAVFVVHARWSPDGMRLLFESNRALDGSDAVQAGNAINLFVVDADGRHLTSITELTGAGASTSSAEWSPDGSRITYQSNRTLDGDDGVGNSQNMWVADADGTGATPLTGVADPGVFSGGPHWSPDGTQIAYGSNRALTGFDAPNPGGGRNVWILAEDGSQDEPLTELSNVAASADQPSWSPDGARLAYSSQRALDGEDAVGDGLNLWVIDADDGDTMPVTSFASNGPVPQFPRWSPDGAKLYYSSSGALDGTDGAAGARNAWVIGVDGDGATALTTYENGVSVGDLRPAPDGSAVFFASSADPDGGDAAIGTTNIWSVGADGTSLHPVTRYTADNSGTYDPGGF
jgi:Tol biopolymer transport system component